MTTCNLTTKALMENPELAVSLDATETEQVWKLFRYQFWEGSEKEMLQKGTLDGVESENRFSEPVPDEGVRCSNISGRRSSILDECLALIESATESIDVTSYGWGNKEITSALMDCVKEGVRISVIGRNHRAESRLIISRRSGTRVVTFTACPSFMRNQFSSIRIHRIPRHWSCQPTLMR